VTAFIFYTNQYYNLRMLAYHFLKYSTFVKSVSKRCHKKIALLLVFLLGSFKDVFGEM